MSDNQDGKKISPPDPFDPARLCLRQDFGSSVGVKKQLIRVPVRKPNRQEFVRVHPDPAFRLKTAVIELKDEREVYAVAPELQGDLAAEVKPVQLFTTITRQGDVLLWPCPLPQLDGRINAWHATLMECAEMAMTRWLSVRANMGLGGYEPFVATGDLPEPVWPETTLAELLRIAFRGLYIDRLDHPVVRRLLGQA